MKLTTPHIEVIARPQVDWAKVGEFMEIVGGQAWIDRIIDDRNVISDAEVLAEFAGRECYRSWDAQLNPNVTKVREDSVKYLENILESQHGSVLQHLNFSFILHNVTRVATHELVRHVAGTAFSQESMRYVRLDDIPVWIPPWAFGDEELMQKVTAWLQHTEDLQQWMGLHFSLDEDGTKFSEKKAKTSFMRRWSPQGVSTGMVMTANVRALRWIIERRSEPAAEEEIRIIADHLAYLMLKECPVLFGDFTRTADGSWIPDYKKV